MMRGSMINKTSTTRFAPASSGGLPRNNDSSSAARNSNIATNKGLSSGGAADAVLEEGSPSIWADVRAVLRRRLGDVKFDTWIAPLELVAEVNDEVLIAAPGEMERDRVNTQFSRDIAHAWSQADRRGRAVRIKARIEIEPEVLALARPM